MAKKALVKLFSKLELWRILRFLNRKKLVILLYHGVAPKEIRGNYNYRGKFIEPEAFLEQMGFIKEYFNVMPLDEAVSKLKNGNLPPYSLSITFDDGYENFYKHAFPIIREMGLYATFYIATDFVFKKIPLWVDRLEYMNIPNDDEVRAKLKAVSEEEKESELSRMEQKSDKKLDDFNGDRDVYSPLSIEEIMEMKSAGIQFGAHTQSHPILTKISKEHLDYEIRGSKKILEDNIGAVSSIFCYPNGQTADYDDSVISKVRETGFSGALTTSRGVNDMNTDPYKLKRVTMDMVSTLPQLTWRLLRAYLDSA